MTNPITRVGEAARERVGGAVARLDEASGHPPEMGRQGRVRAYLHAALRDEWDGLERINRDLRLADLFTILNALMGLTALLLAAHGQVRWAIHLVLAGVIFDGVDGAVARLGRGNGPLGGTLDSLADAVSFVVTPTVIVFVWLDPQPDLWHRVAWALPLAAFTTAGLLRLARFEAMRDDGKVRKYFSGLPTPGAAGTLLSLVLLEDVPTGVVAAVAAYLGILMVSRIRFPKLRGWLGIAAGTMVLLVLASFDNRVFQDWATIALLVLMAFYVVLGPFYVLARFGATTAPGEAA